MLAGLAYFSASSLCVRAREREACAPFHDPACQKVSLAWNKKEDGIDPLVLDLHLVDSMHRCGPTQAHVVPVVVVGVLPP